MTTWLTNTTFHLQPIWLQTLVVIYSESRLTSFPSFCAPPSEVALLINSNLSRRPFLRQVVESTKSIYLLLWTGFDSEHAVLFLCHISTQRPMTDRKIEWSNGRCFGQQQLLHWKKKIWAVFFCSLKITKHQKTWLALELSQYRKSGSMFSSSEPVAARSDCRRLGIALCLCSPVKPAP